MDVADDEVVDAVEATIGFLEASEDIAYAEAGGVNRCYTNIVISTSRTDNTTDIDTWGVWWRLFADAGADYRYLNQPTYDDLETSIERSLRAATVLDHDSPPHFDALGIHRAVDPGWASPGAALSEIDPDEKAAVIRAAVEGALEGRPIDRTRVEYIDDHIDQILLTTTGTALRTSVERASIDATMATVAGFKGRQHYGATRGRKFLDAVPMYLDDFADQVSSAGAVSATDTPPTGRKSITLSPYAAAQLIHQFSHYLEIDACYIGMSPIRLGDTVGPTSLTITDEVTSGAWSASAFDAEGSHVRPVTLVDNGQVVARFHSTASAIEEDAHPHGSVIQSIGFDHPPRVHGRLLTVQPGMATHESLLDEADIYVERFGAARYANEATRTKRASGMPPSVLYAKTIRNHTPSRFSAEAADQRVELTIREAYTVSGGETSRRVRNGVYEFEPDDMTTIEAVGRVSETYTGVCVKHKSRLPYTVRSPGIRLRGELALATK